VLVQELIGLALRTSGILGVGQTALPQDLADAQTMLKLLMQQWRQKRWLVFRLATALVPLVPGKAIYRVGPPGALPAPDIVTDGGFRPANIQSCYLRQEVGSGPNSYPIDFPMRVLESRQQWDAISLKDLQSWPALIFYDPVVPVADLYVWPIPNQSLFHLYVAWQSAIDVAASGAQTLELETVLPAETQLALMYNLALLTAVNYKLPQDQALEAMARATLNTVRMTNFALQPLRMPASLIGTGTRMKNPLGGFVFPETSAGVPVGTSLA
jgi:hypothetical protein